MTAIMGTFVSIKTMADGSPRITLDMSCTLQEIAAMGLMPGAAFALARLTQESTKEAAQVETQEKVRPGSLCIMACNFCADPLFYEWMRVEVKNSNICDEINAKEYILFVCNVETRKELDRNSRAAGKFHQYIRQPFLAWRERQ